MNNFIKRYVYDVTRRLPESQREEVGKELLSNINDMLPDNPTEEAIKTVLMELGEPRLLAANYRTKPRHLVAPEWMDDYLQTLKIVMIILGTITLVSGLIEHILNPESVNVIGIIFEVFFTVIFEVIQSLLSAFAIVTLIFTGISLYQSKTNESKWTIEKLPELPKENVKKISRVESIIGLSLSVIFGTLFLYVVWNNHTYIGWYENGDFEQVVIPFFNGDVLRRFLPLFITSIGLTILKNVLKLKTGYWSIPIATIHTIDQIVSIVILFLFSTTTNLVNLDFWAEASANTTVTVEQFSEGFSKGFYGLAWCITVFGTLDVVTTWFKTLKYKPKITIK